MAISLPSTNVRQLCDTFMTHFLKTDRPKDAMKVISSSWTHIELSHSNSLTPIPPCPSLNLCLWLSWATFVVQSFLALSLSGQIAEISPLLPVNQAYLLLNGFMQGQDPEGAVEAMALIRKVCLCLCRCVTLSRFSFSRLLPSIACWSHSCSASPCQKFPRTC